MGDSNGKSVLCEKYRSSTCSALLVWQLRSQPPSLFFRYFLAERRFFSEWFPVRPSLPSSWLSASF